MLRQTPPLEAIEAFMLAARADSFREAAAALALSPSALSRRVQQLEAFTGAALFDRSGPRPRLTESGRRYLEEVAPALEDIRRATRDLGGGGPLRLTASHSLAVGWLLPRLQRLHEAGVELELGIEQGLGALRAGRADVALCGGEAAPADLPSDVLIDLEAVLVSAPDGVHGASGGDLAELPGGHLLQARGSPRLWERWFAATGRPGPRAGGTCFPTLDSLYAAAANGLGLALAVPLAADRYLAEGRLKARLPLRARVGEQYRIVFASERTRRRAAVARLADRLREECADSQARFAAATACG